MKNLMTNKKSKKKREKTIKKLKIFENELKLLAFSF